MDHDHIVAAKNIVSSQKCCNRLDCDCADSRSDSSQTVRLLGRSTKAQYWNSQHRNEIDETIDENTSEILVKSGSAETNITVNKSVDESVLANVGLNGADAEQDILGSENKENIASEQMDTIVDNVLPDTYHDDENLIVNGTVGANLTFVTSLESDENAQGEVVDASSISHEASLDIGSSNQSLPLMYQSSSTNEVNQEAGIDATETFSPAPSQSILLSNVEDITELPVATESPSLVPELLDENELMAMLTRIPTSYSTDVKVYDESNDQSNLDDVSKENSNISDTTISVLPKSNESKNQSSGSVSSPHRLIDFFRNHMLTSTILFTLVVLICCFYCKSRRPRTPRGEYRAIADDYADFAFHDQLDADDEAYDDDDDALEEEWTNGGGGKKHIELSSVRGKELNGGLSLEEVNG